jgi:hypothetical protein
MGDLVSSLGFRVSKEIVIPNFLGDNSVIKGSPLENLAVSTFRKGI